MATAFSLRRRVAIAALASVLVTAAALTIAMMAAAGARAQGRELSERLVPAASAAVRLSADYTDQQVTLRNYITTGQRAALVQFRQASARIPAEEAHVAALLREYPQGPAALAAVVTARRVWFGRVAVPQLGAARLHDFARARSLQADIVVTRPYSLAVRNKVTALQAWIAGAQADVAAKLLSAQSVLLGGLIAMGGLVAVITVGGVLVVRRWLLVPFQALRRATDRVAAGDYSTRIPGVGPAELADLGQGAEQMRTRLVAALEEAGRAEDKFRRFFDFAPDATMTIAEDQSIVMVNTRAEQMFGYPAGELAGRPLSAILPAAAGPGDCLATLGPEPRAAVELTAVARDGREFPVESTVTALRAGNGTVGLISLRDVSERLAAQAEAERLRAEAERERYQRRLEQSQKMESLGQLVGGVAHDFNNLLNVIGGYTDFLAEQLRSEAGDDPRRLEMLEDVGQVRGAAQRAAALTRQLLVFARRDVMHPRVLDVNQVVGGIEHMLRRTIGEHIELVTNCEPELWPVLADSGQLDQILVNLAVNASDAMPKGGKMTIDTANINVDEAYAAARPGLASGRYVRLRVSDTGTGMDREVAARVFEPFYTTKPAGHGTGLGLATVHGIVTRAGGYPQIYSEPGLGTTVSILLPVTDQAPDTAQAATPAPARGQGETILVAEDEESLAKLVRRILVRNGYQVRLATSPAATLSHASDLEQHIDLLLTDAVMPEMLGNEVAARVRAVRPGLPVLYMSGYAQPVLDTQGALDPNTELLEKPFSEVTLLVKVRQALDGSPPRGGRC